MSSFRAQYAFPAPPLGWKEEDFVYYFDQTNLPVLATLSAPGDSARGIVLQLQNDAEFRLRGIQISGNTQSMQIRWYDAFGNFLSASVVEADRDYSGTINGALQIGRLPVMVEPEIPCPAGGFLSIDIEIL